MGADDLPWRTRAPHRSARQDSLRGVRRDGAAVRRLYADTKPDLVIHLAGVVGGIGINRRHPGKFFYDNLMMGVQPLDQARLNSVRKFVAAGTICSYPKFTPVP